MQRSVVVLCGVLVEYWTGNEQKWATGVAHRQKVWLMHSKHSWLIAPWGIFKSEKLRIEGIWRSNATLPHLGDDNTDLAVKFQVKTVSWIWIRVFWLQEQCSLHIKLPGLAALYRYKRRDVAWVDNRIRCICYGPVIHCNSLARLIFRYFL